MTYLTIYFIGAVIVFILASMSAKDSANVGLGIVTFSALIWPLIAIQLVLEWVFNKLARR